ncbi:MAG: CBS domain-containing protein [Selenomonadaceae bacterium]
MKAKDIMDRKIFFVEPDTPVQMVARYLVERHLSGLTVVDKEMHALGMVSEGDVLRKKIAPKALEVIDMLGDYEGMEEYREAWRKMGANTAAEIMTAPIIAVDVNDDVKKVGEAVLNHHIKQIPVLENGKFVGIITRSDLVRILLL